MPSSKPKTGQRYRICGTPSRLGCLTCKIRRVKCGEEKPFCRRCTSTGRKCDGYAPVPEKQPAKSAIIKKAPASSSSPNGSPSILPVRNPVEQKLLYFFATVTAPSLTGTFSSNFWETKVVQMSMVEPTIRHAVMAIGAIHQDFVNRHHRPGNRSDSWLQTFAFRHYTKAISNLHTLMSTRRQQMDVILISCILFICIDCLLGNHASAIVHLKAGLRILQNIKAEKEHTDICAGEWEADYSPPLISLGVQAATFVNPHLTKERTELWTFLRTAGVHSKPAIFNSLDEARHALDTISAEIMTDRTTTSSILEHGTIDPPSVVAQKHMAGLQVWSEALDAFISKYVSLDPTVAKLRQGATLLKVHSLVISIVIGPVEDANEKFEDILALANYFITTGGCFTSSLTNISFATNQGVIAPLFFTALRAPHAATKRRAVELLSRAPGREGMWDTEDAIRVAESAQLDFSRHTTTPPATVEDDVPIWLDVAARLKSKSTWPLWQRQPDEARPKAFTGNAAGLVNELGLTMDGKAETPNFEPQFAWKILEQQNAVSPLLKKDSFEGQSEERFEEGRFGEVLFDESF